jgi:PERQ amino acid-rich with GYF domain-containing protein
VVASGVAPLPQQWFYKDPKGNVQGPFNLKIMIAWNKAGYFAEDLLISDARSIEGALSPAAWIKLGEAFVAKPFLSAYKRA